MLWRSLGTGHLDFLPHCRHFVCISGPGTKVVGGWLTSSFGNQTASCITFVYNPPPPPPPPPPRVDFTIRYWSQGTILCNDFAVYADSPEWNTLMKAAAPRAHDFKIAEELIDWMAGQFG